MGTEVKFFLKHGSQIHLVMGLPVSDISVLRLLLFINPLLHCKDGVRSH